MSYKKIVLAGRTYELSESAPVIRRYILETVKYGKKESTGYQYILFTFKDRKFKKRIITPLTILDHNGSPSFLFMFLQSIGKAYEDIPTLEDYIGLTFTIQEQIDAQSPVKEFKRHDGSFQRTANMVTKRIDLDPQSEKINFSEREKSKLRDTADMLEEVNIAPELDGGW